ncbi:MAG: hypothetical protein LW817_04190 [Candidatus Caenarcaniphilales bacterium]|jgi:hypothetical protein|nr:hypothetical protein [Candidatus Caenarcaniphilales bacterium]
MTIDNNQRIIYLTHALNDIKIRNRDVDTVRAELKKDGLTFKDVPDLEAQIKKIKPQRKEIEEISRARDNQSLIDLSNIVNKLEDDLEEKYLNLYGEDFFNNPGDYDRTPSDNISKEGLKSFRKKISELSEEELSNYILYFNAPEDLEFYGDFKINPDLDLDNGDNSVVEYDIKRTIIEEVISEVFSRMINFPKDKSQESLNHLSNALIGICNYASTFEDAGYIKLETDVPYGTIQEQSSLNEFLDGLRKVGFPFEVNQAGDYREDDVYYAAELLFENSNGKKSNGLSAPIFITQYD